MHTTASSVLALSAPFILLLALWFFLLNAMRKGRFGYQKTIIGPMQEMLQATIVPELHALRDSVDRLSAEIKSLGDRSGQ